MSRRNLVILPALVALILPSTATAADSFAEAETFPLAQSSTGKVRPYPGAVGSVLKIWSNGWATRNVSVVEASDQLVVRAAGDQCDGAPVLTVEVDGRRVFQTALTSSTLKTYSAAIDVPRAAHAVTLRYANDRRTATCDRNVLVDSVRFVGKSSATVAGITATAASGVPATLPSGNRTPTWPGSAIPAPAIGLPAGYSLAWNDEFSAPLSTTKWRVYGTSPRLKRNVTVSGGELRVAANATSTGGLSSSATWTHGIFELRGRMTGAEGYTNAFLLWPTDERWPEHGEIDLSEIPWGTRHTSRTTVHYADPTYTRHWTDTPRSDYSTYHTWTVVWSPLKIDFYVDGVKYMSESTLGAIPKTAHHWALQTEKGPKTNWLPAPSAGSSATAHVDYVRTWQLKP